MEYKIEDGVPVPPKGSSKPGSVLDTIKKLEPGQSVFLAGQKSTLGGFSRAISKRAKEPRKYTTRNVVENGVKGVRIWRIA